MVLAQWCRSLIPVCCLQLCGLFSNHCHIPHAFFVWFIRPEFSDRATMLAGAASRPAAAENTAAVAFLEKLLLSPASTPVLTLCHGFDCRYRNQFVITPPRLSFIRAMLAGARSARDERKALSKIVAWYDREGGKVAGTVNRIAYAGAAKTVACESFSKRFLTE